MITIPASAENMDEISTIDKFSNVVKYATISGEMIKIGILNVNNIAFVFPASPTSPSSTAILD